MPEAALPPVLADATSAAMLARLWATPFPVTLLDGEWRVVDANPAFLDLAALAREQVLGRQWLTPAQTEDAGLAGRLHKARLVDASGQERHCNVSLQTLPADDGSVLWLALWQDQTAEQRARSVAQAAQEQLLQWLDLAGAAVIIFDDAGAVLQHNREFERLAGLAPTRIDKLDEPLQALLGWHSGALRADLRGATASLEATATLALPAGARRPLAARLRASAGAAGGWQVMAVIEDRSAEEERDLARLEIEMLMDTASVGVATYDPSRGWLLPAPSSADGSARRSTAAAGLEGISRELVETESLPEYERLQAALRQRERAEVRYAVRHPELGQRWLLTRVQPGTLAEGRPTTSVVTMDVTDQERAQRRNEQLLRELTTILDGSTAGIAYLRGNVLVRCNRRFERMLGLADGSAAGAALDAVFGHRPDTLRALHQAHAALADGRAFEAEVPGAPGWYSLSVRRAEAGGEAAEAVAVLTDITRLKAQQTELELLVRERELMFSLSEVGIAYLRGSRIERANQAMATLTGYAATELTALDGAELYESARACVDFEARVAQALRSQGRFVGERRLRRRDGSLLWVQVAMRPVDADAPATGVICSFVDIDERQRGREELALQADRTRAILNSVLVGIVTVGANGIEWMNRSARRMFAGELADFVGEPISIVATADAEHPLRRLDWLHKLAEGRAETFECQLQARDGRAFWVVGNAVATGRDAAHATGRQLTFALLDIERRRQAEISIAQAQASLQRVIETAPLAIALFDASSLRMLQVNQMAATFFARPLGQLLGCRPEQVCPPAKAAQLRAWLLQAAPGSEMLTRELLDDGEAGDGEASRVWDTRIVPLPASGGVAPQLLLVASDVTEQRAAGEARLQAAIAQRELLVREVHHRIKNNLQGVAGLLQQNAARHPEVAAILAEAVSQVQAIAQVYGLQVGAGGPLRMANVVEAITVSVQRTFGRAIRFEADADLDHLLPEAESIPIALTINELLTNAVKHAAQGEVECKLHSVDDAVDIVITNQGRLAEGFSLSHIPGGVSGLGLVRALLPRRSAHLAIEQAGEQVRARVTLRPPSVQRPA